VDSRPRARRGRPRGLRSTRTWRRYSEVRRDSFTADGGQLPRHVRSARDIGARARAAHRPVRPASVARPSPF
jgi:hypothetical protein